VFWWRQANNGLLSTIKTQTTNQKHNKNDKTCQHDWQRTYWLCEFVRKLVHHAGLNWRLVTRQLEYDGRRYVSRFHFQVGQGTLQSARPADKALVAEDDSLLVQPVSTRVSSRWKALLPSFANFLRNIACCRGFAAFNYKESVFFSLKIFWSWTRRFFEAEHDFFLSWTQVEHGSERSELSKRA